MLGDMRSIWRTADPAPRRAARDRPGAGRWALWSGLGPGDARAIGLVLVADGLVGVSFGALATGGGLSWWVPVVMSLVVFAGGAQFAAVAVAVGGGSATAAVVTGLALNARHLPFGFAVRDVLAGSWPRRLAGAHVMIDESVAFTVRYEDPVRRRAVYWASGAGLFVVWNVATAAGASLGQVMGDPATWGLDAAFPAVLLALVLPTLDRPRLRLAALAGAAVAVAGTPYLPVGTPVLAALVALVVLLPRREEAS